MVEMILFIVDSFLKFFDSYGRHSIAGAKNLNVITDRNHVPTMH